MARELRSIDISDVPELLRLAEEVRTTNEPHVLRRAGEDIAVLMPIGPTTKRRGRKPALARRSPAPEEVARSKAGIVGSAGSWRDIDAEALKEYIRERRDASRRPPVRL